MQTDLFGKSEQVYILTMFDLARYVLSRVLALIPILLVISAAVFFLIRLTPSDPIVALTSGRRISDDTRAALIAQYHLDKP